MLLAFALIIIGISCNNEDNEWGDVIVEGREAYKELPTFQDGMVWDEVTYLTTDPSQYTLNHYEVASDTLVNGKVLNSVFKDSVIIGSVTKDGEGKVYFTPTGASTPTLLYDFVEVNNNIRGTGMSYYTTTLTLYEDLPREYKGESIGGAYCVAPKTRCVDPFSYKWTWMEDVYGGITINGVGSTAGILSPVEPVKAGYSREVLQVYNKYSQNHRLDVTNWVYIEHNGLKYETYYYGLVYNNFSAAVLHHIPFNFWKSPGIFNELADHGLISHDDARNIYELRNEFYRRLRESE